jgi:hypothetical protein
MQVIGKGLLDQAIFAFDVGDHLLGDGFINPSAWFIAGFRGDIGQ